jgi:uncharacterized protein YbcC (UPF0753/DUF2309 family)
MARLAAFMDEGLAEWKCPIKAKGFIVLGKLAVYDNDMPKMVIGTSRENKDRGTRYGNGYSSTDFTKIFTWHLAALPGWTGYINHRTTYHSEWQQEYPITLEDYHAVRLWVAKEIDAEIYPEECTSTISSLSKLQYIWLKHGKKLAKELVKVLDSKQISTQQPKKKDDSDAQMVFVLISIRVRNT